MSLCIVLSLNQLHASEPTEAAENHASELKEAAEEQAVDTTRIQETEQSNGELPSLHEVFHSSQSFSSDPKDEEIKKLQKKVQTQQQEIASLKQALDELPRKVSEDERKRIREGCGIDKVNISNLITENSTLKKQSKQYKAMQKMIWSILQLKREKLTSASNKYARLFEEHNNLTSQHNDLGRQYRELQTSYNDLSNDMDKQIQVLSKELDETKERLRDREVQYKISQKANKKLNKQIQNYGNIFAEEKEIREKEEAHKRFRLFQGNGVLHGLYGIGIAYNNQKQINLAQNK